MKLKIIVTLLLVGVLLNINFVSGELGNPKLDVSISIDPYQIPAGGSGTLTVYIREVGGEDWAKDVVVKPYSNDPNIYISPSKSSPVNIEKYGSATFTFKIYVDKNANPGIKTIYVDINYYDTGLLDVGEFFHSETYSTTFEVIPAEGSLYIESNPPGAKIYIDGKYMGITPKTIDVTPGSHELKLVKQGFEEYSTEVYISPGEFKTINAKLVPKFGYLTIHSTEGANVYIDGKYVGHPPIHIKLDSGYHTIKITKKGFKDYTKKIYISSGEIKTIDAKLVPIVSSTSNKNNILLKPSSLESYVNNYGFQAAILLIGLVLIGGSILFIKKKKTKKKKENKDVEKKIDNVIDFPRELLNKYIPLEKLGEGGFGKVFKVKRKGGTLPIALKIPSLNEKAKKSLLKEIEAWKNLNHPNIVKMYDAYIEPIPHIEMEYIDGVKLNGKIIRDLDKYPKPLDPKEALRIVKQIAEGLKHAHSRGVIHRDIKPSNILLTSDIIPKISDWGLAKIGAKSSTTSAKALTLLYSAPEQIDEGEYGKTDERTDIYQLGVLFYELLTGKLPYEGSSPAQVISKIINPSIKPTPPSKINPKLSIFNGIFDKFLAKRKEDRFQSMDEVLEALNSLEELIKEKEKLEETLTKTTELIKKSTDKKEIEKLIKEFVETSTKLALNCAKANDKVGLLEVLETLKAYVKSEENKKELEKAIRDIEYLIKEDIPISKNTIERLEVLLNRIRKEL
ncbi:protein kinase domain-containing protein [Methanocaldococcus infernus]|uniref:protein kinase domain-containing protein n=1 Tax=Methanocaldococcus infernus TaxID=67760 RepID=UPI000A52F7B6|nr:protein kinase [Methanocaldococcus infernus]